MPSHAEIMAGASIQAPPKTVWLPTYDSYYGQGSYVQQRVKIPLWMLLLLIAAPTAYLWYTDRRAKPWQCPKCRYDLRGLDGGVCPECGHETTGDA